MKLEYVSEHEFVRLFDFNETEARLFRDTLVRLLNEGTIQLDREPYIHPVDGIRMALEVGKKDLGIRPVSEDLEFRCVLPEDGWQWAIEVVEPFCKDGGSRGYDWLYNLEAFPWRRTLGSRIMFFFSPDGYWDGCW